MNDEVIALLTWVAAGGSGYLASWLFDQARDLFPRPTPLDWQQAGAAWHLLWHVLYSPRLAQVTNIAGAALLGFCAALAVSLLNGDSFGVAFDVALDIAFWVPLVSWFRHLSGKLSTETELRR